MNYYEILEVREDASPEVISMAYKALCRKYHPDVYQGPTEEANSIMALINEAYEVLSNKDKRRAYDVNLYWERSKGERQETEDEEPELGVAWIGYYSFLQFINVLISIYVIIRTVSSEDFDYTLEAFPVFMSIGIAIEVVLICVRAYLGIGLIKLQKAAYYINFGLLILHPVYKAIGYLSDENMTLRVVIAVIYSIMNMIYFQKRKHLFIKTERTKYSFKKLVLPLVLVVSISFSSWYLLQPNVPVEDKEAIRTNFNELSHIYGHKNSDELLKFVSDEYGDTFLDNENNDNADKENFEKIATEYLGAASYEEVQGYADPFNNNVIDSFEEYQEYIINLARNS